MKGLRLSGSAVQPMRSVVGAAAADGEDATAGPPPAAHSEMQAATASAMTSSAGLIRLTNALSPVLPIRTPPQAQYKTFWHRF